MSGNYYMKLYHDILRDPKMGRLSDSAFRRCIELFLLASEQPGRDGTLPEMSDISWLLRIEIEQLEDDLAELSEVGIIDFIEGIPFVKNFAKRQAKISDAEKQRAYRERMRQNDTETLPERDDENTLEKPECYGSVTERITDIDKELDKEKEEEKKEYIELPDGNSAELTSRDEKQKQFETVLAYWAFYFPKKPQPRKSTANLKRKVVARFKSPHFRENWREAMRVAANSPTLHGESWFNFGFFVKNDENYVKCLDEWMRWKDEQGQAKQLVTVPERSGEKLETNNGFY